MINIDDVAIVCLALKEYGHVGPKLFQQLMITYGEPANLFERDPEDISSMVGINLERAQKITDSQESLAEAREIVNHLSTINIDVISYFDDAYPESLRKIADPPLLLYVRGDLQLLSSGGAAIVGTTSPDNAGIKAAVDFAREFSKRGITVVSGLAAGIDSAAHLGCLKNNGKTIAVLGCGHLNIYPEENISLAQLITESGVVISEFNVHADAVAGRLVSRNRIIAALADVVIMAQIGDNKKGELYTARAALDQGKSVFVFDPDDIHDSETLLENMIIKIKDLGEIDEILKYSA
ncbi:MAG: DNA-protecting protein DprA [candidate division Zixibacteria bacterium]|nr:DNA-protecting protein DprA [candidate division Zixibacteria bacterium]